MESSRNTVIRSLHAVGAAGWFGGSLMGEAWGARACSLI